MSASLGEKLRNAREARGMTISEISEHTRIASRYLEAIEADDYSPLPGGVFNKGFIKSYAKYVGLDEKESAEDYNRIAASQAIDEEPVVKSYRSEVLTDGNSNRSMIPTLILALLILGGMTAGILYAVNWYQNQQIASQNPVANTVNKNAVATTVNASSSNANANTGNTNANVPAAPISTSGEMTVVVKTTAEVAVQSVTDGKTEQSSILPDLPRTYNGEESIKLSYYRGLYPNIQITVNGKAVTLPTAPKPPKKNAIEFEINKANLGQILQSGAITYENTAAINTNANVAPPAR